MPRHLARHCQEVRLRKGLSRGQLARLVGYENISKGANRIHHFEISGNAGQELLRKLAAVLAIDETTFTDLAKRDRREFLEGWRQWVNEPIQPFLVIRLIPAFYVRQRLPEDVSRTLEHAEAWASSVAVEKQRQCCLVWSRRLSCWFSEDGSLLRRTEAEPGKPNMPYMWIP